MSLAQSINLANYFSPPGPYFAHFCSNAIVENSVNITRHGSVLISIGGTWRSVRYRKHLAARDQHTDRTVGEIYIIRDSHKELYIGNVTLFAIV